MLEGIGDNQEDDLSNLKPLLNSGDDDSGTVSSEIREKLYSTENYSSEHCKVHDEDELKQDVRRAVYDLGADPAEWADEIYEDVLETAEQDEYGRVNGGDIADAIRKRNPLN